MPNFGLSRQQARGAANSDLPPPNWRRGFFRLWVLLSAGWIMGWVIYFMMEGFLGHISSSGELASVPLTLFAPPIALWLFGMAAA